MADNGMRSFALHVANADQVGIVAALARETTAMGFGAAAESPGDVDPETAARRHLANAVASSAAPAFTMSDVDDMTAEFRLLGTETLALTGTTSVKFRQVFNKVPVFGSLVTVELGTGNDLVGINSALGTPSGVSPVAAIAPAAAVRAVEQAGGEPGNAAVGRLLFYHDGAARPARWRLCYLFEDVPVGQPTAMAAGAGEESRHLLAPTFNFMVDAHTGEIVARLPRGADATVTMTAIDMLQATRSLRVSIGSTPPALDDPVLNVRTFDFNFSDVRFFPGRLPGGPCVASPVFDPGAVSAHANAVVVAEFLRDILKRNGLDGQGGIIKSSVNCLYENSSPANRTWRNAAWAHGQMLYGQRANGAGLFSLAADLDIVAHELAHGLNQATADIIYQGESGALNESYSDIFGIIVANFGNPDPLSWDYRLGMNFRGTGVPLRDLANPAAHGQPNTMAAFAVKPLNDDNGGVHTNSGIHNKAAHGVMTARNANGGALFSPTDLAALFYLALTQQLSRTSLFSDSRRGVEQAASTLFRTQSSADIALRLDAIRRAYAAVGVH